MPSRRHLLYPHRPTFKLGVVGLTAAERQAVQAFLPEHAGSVDWRLAPTFGQADAWLVAGRQVRVLSPTTIAVYPATPTERLLRLDLPEANRPVAFTSPLPAGLEVACEVDLADRIQLGAALRRLEHWLTPLRARFALGRDVIRYGELLRHGVFHVFWKERLLAVLDFRNGQGAMASFMAPEMMATAEWRRRPGAANEAPPGFLPMSTRELGWTYVRHCEADLLPPAYRARTLFYRGPARVPIQWLDDAQLLLLRELAQQPGSLAELRQRTGLPAERAERALACLYYASCVTSTPAKAARQPQQPADRAAPASLPSLASELFEGDARFARARPARELTVPAGLA